MKMTFTKVIITCPLLILFVIGCIYWLKLSRWKEKIYHKEALSINVLAAGHNVNYLSSYDGIYIKGTDFKGITIIFPNGEIKVDQVDSETILEYSKKFNLTRYALSSTGFTPTEWFFSPGDFSHPEAPYLLDFYFDKQGKLNQFNYIQPWPKEKFDQSSNREWKKSINYPKIRVGFVTLSFPVSSYRLWEKMGVADETSSRLIFP